MRRSKVPGGRGAAPASISHLSFTDVFDDLFGEFMGGAARQAAKPRRRSRYNMEITLEEAFRGRECTNPRADGGGLRELRRHGRGSRAPSPRPARPALVTARCARSRAFSPSNAPAPIAGRGRVSCKNPCKTCAGVGRVQKESTLTVDIPQGVEEGTRIRLTGEGQAGVNGGPTGDLYVFLSVKPHPIFQRDGNDLHCRVPIGFVTAALGDTIEVPSLDGGSVKVQVPEGTQSGKQFRVRGKGMPVLKGGSATGDLHVEVQVETPVRLSRKQKDMLRAFEKETAAGSHPATESFFARVRDFLGSTGTH